MDHHITPRDTERRTHVLLPNKNNNKAVFLRCVLYMVMIFGSAPTIYWSIIGRGGGGGGLSNVVLMDRQNMTLPDALDLPRKKASKIDLERELVISTTSKLAMATRATPSSASSTSTTTIENGGMPKKPIIPSCENSNGCIILFFHIPKTGGTTIYETFHQYSTTKKIPRKVLVGQVELLNSRQRRKFRYRRDILGEDRNTTLWEIENAIDTLSKQQQQQQQHKQQQTNHNQTSNNYRNNNNATNSNMIHFFEFHAGKNPSFASLVRDGSLSRWKAKGLESNITIFTFTILREPISWSLSAYHMICIVQGGGGGGGGDRGGSSSNCRQPSPGFRARMGQRKLFEYALQPNAQCAFLIKAGFPLHDRPKENVFHPNATECTTVLWQDLVDYMDWVGRVEAYSETMEILMRVTGLNLTKIKVSNVATDSSTTTATTLPSTTTSNRLQRKDIINTTTESRVQFMTKLDAELYRRVKERYQCC